MTAIEKQTQSIQALEANRPFQNRRGQYTRALEEAISTHKSQWPRAWNGTNPINGGRSFHTMSPTERLTLLKTLVLWSLHSSEAVQVKIKDAYKQSRHDDDLNQPLSVQPWGRDSEKRRYWLIEGQDDTSFRLYRESNPARAKNTWWSVAGTIDEMKATAVQLETEGGQAGRRLAHSIYSAIPRFEATDEKRKRREYRLAQRARFTRPELGFSLYEGRTRGKRMKYTYSDEDDSEAPSTRRSTRGSGVVTPQEDAGPTFTASGRQVRSRVGGMYGETVTGARGSGTVAPSAETEAGVDGPEDELLTNGRPRRSASRKEVNGWAKGEDHIETYNSVDEMDEESDAASSGGDAEDYAGDYEDEDDGKGDSVEEMDEDDDEDMMSEDDRPQHRSLVVQLKVKKGPKVNGENGVKAVQQLTPEGSEEGKTTNINGNQPVGLAELPRPLPLEENGGAIAFRKAPIGHEELPMTHLPQEMQTSPPAVSMPSNTLS